MNFSRELDDLMQITKWIFLLNLLPLVSVLAFSSENETKVSGQVNSFDFGGAVRVKDANIVFERPNGINVTATTSDVGEYATTLPSEYSYTVTVTAKGFCPVHRPAFVSSSYSSLKFDFTLTAKCPGDRIVVGKPELYFETPIPAYFEEGIALGKHGKSQLIISFGMRTKSDHGIQYVSLHVTDKGAVLPVTLSFGTYTIRADHAVFDRDTGVVLAEGNVSIADGTDRAPQRRVCTALKLHESNPKPKDCRKHE
jgi:hypothetical protein